MSAPWLKPLAAPRYPISRKDSASLKAFALLCYQGLAVPGWCGMINGLNTAVLPKGAARKQLTFGLVMFASPESLRRVDADFDEKVTLAPVEGGARSDKLEARNLPTTFTDNLAGAEMPLFHALVKETVDQMTLHLNRSLSPFPPPHPALYMGLREELDTEKARNRYRSVSLSRVAAAGFSNRECCAYGVVLHDTVDRAIRVSEVLGKSEHEVLLPKGLVYQVYTQQQARNIVERGGDLADKLDAGLKSLALPGEDERTTDVIYYTSRFEDAKILLIRKPEKRRCPSPPPGKKRRPRMLQLFDSPRQAEAFLTLHARWRADRFLRKMHGELDHAVFFRSAAFLPGEFGETTLQFWDTAYAKRIVTACRRLHGEGTPLDEAPPPIREGTKLCLVGDVEEEDVKEPTPADQMLQLYASADQSLLAADVGRGSVLCCSSGMWATRSPLWSDGAACRLDFSVEAARVVGASAWVRLAPLKLYVKEVHRLRALLLRGRDAVRSETYNDDVIIFECTSLDPLGDGTYSDKEHEQAF